ncbi:hypothetical protein LMG24235_01597 [Paraburkholderia sabiae]|nr:hypothetical protein LMG24235_01597 [Paraburkholderia sabiae]
MGLSGLVGFLLCEAFLFGPLWGVLASAGS